MDAKQLNALVHDREAAAYDDRFAIDHGPGLGDELRRELAVAFPTDRRTHRLLDLACGTGFAAVGALHAALADQVHACDLSVEMLRRTRANAAATAREPHLLASDAERLPYADGAFEVIVARGALHHVPDPVALLAEARRVLAPGGTLVCLAEPTAAGERQVGAVVGTLWRSLELARRIARRTPSPEQLEQQRWELASMAANLHTFTPGDLEQLATKAGFEEITVGTASWAWVLALGVNYYLAGEFERFWTLPPMRAATARTLRLVKLLDRLLVERLVPDRFHATVWAVLR